MSTPENQAEQTNVELEKTKDANTPSEGGWRAWLVVFGAWCGVTAASGSRSALGTFQTYVLNHQLRSMEPSSVAWIFSFYTFNSLAWGLIVGPAFDKFGSRWLLLGGSVVLCGAFFIVGECTEYWHFFLAIGLLGGTGSCLVHTTCYGCVGQWFEEKRATASGIVATGSSVGGVVFILSLENLVTKVGFAWSARVVAFIMLFLCVLSNLLARSKRISAEDVTWKPSFSIFKSWTVSLTAAGIWFLEWGYFVPTGYLSSYALAQGFSTSLSYQVLAIFFASAFFGRLVPGFIADRVGRFNTLIVTVTICTVLPFALWLQIGSSEALLLLFSILFGFWSACDTSLTPPCLGQLCESKDYGRYYAGAFAVSSFAPLTSLPIAGALISATGGDYWALIVFTGLCYGIATVCFVAARVRAVGWSCRRVF